MRMLQSSTFTVTEVYMAQRIVHCQYRHLSSNETKGLGRVVWHNRDEENDNGAGGVPTRDHDDGKCNGKDGKSNGEDGTGDGGNAGDGTANDYGGEWYTV